MTNSRSWLYLAIGLFFGGLMAVMLANQQDRVLAAADHYQDYILCTGAVSAEYKGDAVYDADHKAYRWHWLAVPFEGIWFLDSSSNRLLGTVVNHTTGKIIGWAEPDVGPEFGIGHGQAAHFMMSTGTVFDGQAALYLAETTTGKLGVYTMGPQAGGGIAIRRHDRVPFRKEGEDGKEQR